MSNLIHNERVKLRAALFNNCAVASLVAGALLPYIQPLFDWWLYSFTASMGLTFGIAFHACAHFYLGNLRD
jgi:hypothetical protein